MIFYYPESKLAKEIHLKKVTIRIINQQFLKTVKRFIEYSVELSLFSFPVDGSFQSANKQKDN